MPTRLRFHPPAVQLSPELRWVLLRAYGPAETPASSKIDFQEVARLARALRLTARIADRLEPCGSEAELSAEMVEILRHDRAQAVALEMERERALQTLTGFAQEHSIPIVLLKGMALRRAGIVPLGARFIGDVDVLVPTAQAWQLQDALAEEGFERHSLPASEAHLPRLRRPGDGAIEIHRVLLGVRAAAGTSLTFADLEDSGLLEPLDEPSGRFALPAKEILAAHVLVHGLVQHGNDPWEYSMAQMFADLIDLGWGTGSGKALALEALPWVRNEIPQSEITAIDDLCGNLVRGAYRQVSELSATKPDELILRHLLAAHFDPRYRDSLRLRWLGPQLSDRSRPAQFFGILRRSLLPTRAQLDTAFGSSTNWPGYIGRWLTLPFATGVRLQRSALNRLKIRFRG